MTENRFKPVFSGKYNDVFLGIKDKNNSELLMTLDTIDKLNELNDENEKLKRVMRKSVLERLLDGFEQSYKDLEKENKELKQFKEKVLELLDEKIKYYRKQPCLAVKLPVDCEYRHSCLHNNSVNVCNKAKENAYRELEKEFKG